MRIETERLIITKFTTDMAEAVHLGSIDDDNRRFVPDEVFETAEEALETIEFLISVYETNDGPLVYPILLRDNTYIGYIQAVPMGDGTYELGYHISQEFRGKGYATEAVKVFLPVIMNSLNLTEILGVCVAENLASATVMEKCGFAPIFEGLDIYQGTERAVKKYIYKI